MEELIRQMIAQSPAVAVLIFLVWRLDARLANAQDIMIELLRAALERCENENNEDQR
jgi:hypothetical protein